jgi:two-component system cell cycle sensor histidine kinase/response regulator CckA
VEAGFYGDRRPPRGKHLQNESSHSKARSSRLPITGKVRNSNIAVANAALFLAGAWLPLIAAAQGNPASTATPDAQTRELILDLFGTVLRVRLSVGLLGLAVILSLMVLSFTAAVFALIARRRVRQANTANRKLEEEISARKRAEDAVRRSEEEYRLLFERNPQLMWLIDRETQRFLAVNNAAIQHYGYTADEFLGMSIQDVRRPEDVAAPPSDSDEFTALGQAQYSGRHKKKDGTPIDVEIREHDIQFTGRDARLAMITDVTERKKLEEQFQQAQRLESIGRLAGGVAHDFNNLLTIINGYSDLALSELGSDHPLRENLSEVRNAGERAAGLTQQLLAFSRKQLVQPIVLSINTTVTDIHRMLQRLIGEDIEIRTNLAADLGNVLADPGQIQQVIMNLAVNSRDAMPHGGALLIETGNVAFDEDYMMSHPEVYPGAYIMLAVTDTGTGMTPEIKARIFEPFFTTKPKGAGTGLGLATVYGMVKQAGGWIWVYSEPGHGTTFKIYFPRVDEPLSPAQPVAKTDVRGDETILVVEDQADLRRLAVMALEKYGYRTYDSSNADEALSFASAFLEPIHLLVTDVIMPGMNGRHLADEMTRLRPGVRVLFMSGYTDDTMAHHGVLDIGVAYLQKPFTPELLGEKVREVLGPRTTAKATILVISVDDGHRRFLRQSLTSAGYAVLEANSGREALKQLTAALHVDLVITGRFIGEQEAFETKRLLQDRHPRLKFVVLSEVGKSEVLQTADPRNASTSRRKPVNSGELLQLVREALSEPRP